jgi:hypothetical protein
MRHCRIFVCTESKSCSSTHPLAFSEATLPSVRQLWSLQYLEKHPIYKGIRILPSATWCFSIISSIHRELSHFPFLSVKSHNISKSKTAKSRRRESHNIFLCTETGSQWFSIFSPIMFIFHRSCSCVMLKVQMKQKIQEGRSSISRVWATTSVPKI